jgi:hypothetical protein
VEGLYSAEVAELEALFEIHFEYLMVVEAESLPVEEVLLAAEAEDLAPEVDLVLIEIQSFVLAEAAVAGLRQQLERELVEEEAEAVEAVEVPLYAVLQEVLHQREPNISKTLQDQLHSFYQYSR